MWKWAVPNRDSGYFSDFIDGIPGGGGSIPTSFKGGEFPL